MEATISHHRLATDAATLHYVTAGDGPPLILIHGFPQTWRQWSPLIDRLATQFRIVAPDLRGIGATPGPAAGYDKHSLAHDLRAVLDHAGVDEPALIVGHDMGSFVAFAYALLYGEATSGLCIVDAPMPGTTLFDQLKTHPRAWHIAFHAARDVAEMLVTGRERAYIAQFVAARIYDPSAISPDDIDLYAAAYSAPGALRAAFEMYRALEQDIVLNRAVLDRQGKLKMPVVVVGGGASLSGALLGAMGSEIADDATSVVVERSGHWVPEEQPDALARIVHDLADRAAGSRVAEA